MLQVDGVNKRTDQSFNSFLDDFRKKFAGRTHHSPGEHINGDLNDLMPPNSAIRTSINSALSKFMTSGNSLYKTNFVNDIAKEAQNENQLRLRAPVDAINSQNNLPTGGFQPDSAYTGRNDIYAQLLKSQVDIDWANADSGSGQKYNSILSGFHNEKKWIDYKNAAKIQTEKEKENEAAKEPEKEVTTPSSVLMVTWRL
jgi:hypothetical protein